ncbi:hypothetical protein B0H13DRAFT_2669781 [Mycena leptocephala]|nr:hypothetical protein B0H13DRAFT_2669781 [Mycena leptocephala]
MLTTYRDGSHLRRKSTPSLTSASSPEVVSSYRSTVVLSEPHHDSNPGPRYSSRDPRFKHPSVRSLAVQQRREGSTPSTATTRARAARIPYDPTSVVGVGIRFAQTENTQTRYVGTSVLDLTIVRMSSRKRLDFDLGAVCIRFVQTEIIQTRYIVISIRCIPSAHPCRSSSVRSCDDPDLRVPISGVYIGQKRRLSSCTGPRCPSAGVTSFSSHPPSSLSYAPLWHTEPAQPPSGREYNDKTESIVHRCIWSSRARGVFDAGGESRTRCTWISDHVCADAHHIESTSFACASRMLAMPRFPSCDAGLHLTIAVQHAERDKDKTRRERCQRYGPTGHILSRRRLARVSSTPTPYPNLSSSHLCGVQRRYVSLMGIDAHSTPDADPTRHHPTTRAFPGTPTLSRGH